MPKQFNTTGVCIPGKHYMVDISAKLAAIMKLVEEGRYFVINRPRQYGKTTTLYLLRRALQQQADYLPLLLSFEGISAESYQDSAHFLPALMLQLSKTARVLRHSELASLIEAGQKLDALPALDEWISTVITALPQRIVLMIDEVDKSGNHPLFLDFLGLLRMKYLAMQQGDDVTFHSVILAGVHDVKSLKLKLRPEDQRQYNSPWNIAVNFMVDMTFSPAEIQTMLADYCATTGVSMDAPAIAEHVYYYTSGYPFLVSAVCQIIDEELQPATAWQPEHVEVAVNRLLTQDNTNFEHVIKQLQNERELYKVVEQIVLFDHQLSYNQDSPVIHLGRLHGILVNRDNHLAIHNRIYQERIYNYLTTNLEIEEITQSSQIGYTRPDQFIRPDQTLDLERVLLKFQEFLKQEYSQRDAKFLERNSRLIFLAFLKPILNGRGFEFKEPQISEEKRLDVVVTFGMQKAIIELKIWRGPEAHQRGLRQLHDYLERTGLDQGYLIIFDFTQQGPKSYRQEQIQVEQKTIFAVWV